MRHCLAGVEFGGVACGGVCALVATEAREHVTHVITGPARPRDALDHGQPRVHKICMPATRNHVRWTESDHIGGSVFPAVFLQGCPYQVGAAPEPSPGGM